MSAPLTKGEKRFAIFMAFLICFFIACFVVATYRSLDDNGARALLREQTEALVEHDRVAEAMSMAFGISEIEAWNYASVFLKWHKKGNVRWHTLAGTMYVESKYNPTLTSPKGAMGIPQIMPQTLEVLCERRGITVDKSTPWRDILMLDLGCELLDEEMRKYGYPKGLGIYHCGSDTFQISQQMYIEAVYKQEHLVETIYKGLCK